MKKWPKIAKVIGGAGFLCSIVLAVGAKHDWGITAGWLLSHSFIALFVLNGLVFLSNVAIALKGMAGAKTPEEVEGRMVPALKGEPSFLSEKGRGIFGVLTAALAGVLLGAFVSIMWQAFLPS